MIRVILAACLSSLAHAESAIVNQALQIKDAAIQKSSTSVDLVPNVYTGTGAPKPGDSDRAFKSREASRFSELGLAEIDGRNSSIVAEIAKLGENKTVPNLIAAGMLTQQLTGEEPKTNDQKIALKNAMQQSQGEYNLLTFNDGVLGAQLPSPKANGSVTPGTSSTGNNLLSGSGSPTGTSSATAGLAPGQTPADKLNPELRENLESIGVDTDEYATLMAQGRTREANDLISGAVPEVDTSNPAVAAQMEAGAQQKAEAIVEAARERIAESSGANSAALAAGSGNSGDGASRNPASLTVTTVGGDSTSRGALAKDGTALNPSAIRRNFALRKGRSIEDYDADVALRASLKKEASENLIGFIRNHILLPHAESNIFTIAHRSFRAAKRHRVAQN